MISEISRLASTSQDIFLREPRSSRNLRYSGRVKGLKRFLFPALGGNGGVDKARDPLGEKDSQVLHGAGVLVEGGREGHDDGPGLREFQRVLKDNRGKRGFAQTEDELAPFLQGYGGRAGHERIG